MEPTETGLYPVRLSGDQVVLREVEEATTAMAWASDVEWFRHLPAEPVIDLAQERAFFEAIVAQAHEVPRRQYNLGIVRNEDEVLVGMARQGVSSPENSSADIGYGIRPDLWGQGLATEAARLLLQFGFETLRLHRVCAYHHPDNLPSRRVLEEIGMTEEGHLRQNMLAHGAWRDSVLWAILEGDWRATVGGSRRGEASGTRQGHGRRSRLRPVIAGVHRPSPGAEAAPSQPVSDLIRHGWPSRASEPRVEVTDGLCGC